MKLNESDASWHPKAALAKQVTDDGNATQWRLWIGSRNLSRDLSWDIGLTLIGQPGSRGSDIPGIPELGQALARHAHLPGFSPGKVRSELREVKWEAPPGCTVTSLRLLDGGLPRTFPPEPPRVRKLVVVSPFLDGTVVRQFGRWGDEETRRTLVSTLPELAKLANQAEEPLVGFNELLFLDSPVPDELLADDGSDKEDANSQDEEPEPRGLHAKLVYVESASGRHIWTGSANATQRGWNGPNVEVVAELEVTLEVVKGLSDFVESATTVRQDELGEAREPDEIQERLEQARKHVAGTWAVTQRDDDSGPVLVNPTDPNPPDLEATMSVGLLGGPQVLWQRGATLVPLPRVAAGEVTELVCCRLAIGEHSISWLQRAPIDPPPGEERDRQALARYLDPRTFLLWIRSLLTGEPCGDGGGRWDGDPAPSTGRKTTNAGPTWWAPTIEEVLRSWTRDPSSLTLIDKKVRHYLKVYEEQVRGEMTPEERAVLSEFHTTWQVLRRSLVSEEK